MWRVPSSKTTRSVTGGQIPVSLAPTGINLRDSVPDPEVLRSDHLEPMAIVPHQRGEQEDRPPPTSKGSLKTPLHDGAEGNLKSAPSDPARGSESPPLPPSP